MCFIHTLTAAIECNLAGRSLDILFATPPCQGMSKNGMGKLLREFREGRRSSFDPRNQLVVPVVKLVDAFRPRALLMENVPEMARTLIETDVGTETIGAFLHRRLALLGYRGDMRVVECADYGVPQRRKRLISLFTRDPTLAQMIKCGSWLPPATHCPDGDLMRLPWRSVSEVIGHLPPLDARDQDSAQGVHPLHRVPVLDANKYFWVSNTPVGATAFDNQCAVESCKCTRNPTHGTARNDEGVNQALKGTPIFCVECGALLPRPWVIEHGKHRIMSGFTSAYKRMRGDLPASALTRNLSYACSDQKLHPTQHRVLSLYEAEILHTIADYDWRWERDDGKRLSDKLIREIIGESVPPLALEIIARRVGEALSYRAKAAA
jgi:DNA (cytosine-5)-methyltransferase 1